MRRLVPRGPGSRQRRAGRSVELAWLRFGLCRARLGPRRGRGRSRARDHWRRPRSLFGAGASGERGVRRVVAGPPSGSACSRALQTASRRRLPPPYRSRLSRPPLYLRRGFGGPLRRGGFGRPLRSVGIGRLLGVLEVAQAIGLPFQPLLLDLPVLDFLPPPIHEPLALQTPVEERALADVSFHCRDAIGLARDRLGGERGGKRADVDLPLRRRQRAFDCNRRASAAAPTRTSNR